MHTLYPGIGRLRLGLPEPISPVSLRFSSPREDALNQMPEDRACPLDVTQIEGQANRRGFLLKLPLEADEELYGFGLQFHSFRQREKGKAGCKKTIRVNSDPAADTGDSHAPVPFYISTRGYGVLVDTARYATFYCGSAVEPAAKMSSKAATTEARSATDLMSHLKGRNKDEATTVRVEIPNAEGADIYIFWGADLQQVVQRYNLFSGGGCLPPRWGLGPWYRTRADFDQGRVSSLARHLRERQIPCDVIGLEPGWQTHSYPCSYEWDAKFPDAASMVEELGADGFQVNLWTHLFTHPSSTAYEPLREHSGDYTAFEGLVPDLALPATREILIGHHTEAHVGIGVSGYKLDECDNSDFNPFSWSFPEITSFPSGLDGEQMHSLLGQLYQETVSQIFQRQGRRTYSSVRASHALAAPYPFVLYSDLYNHRDFVRALVNSGFSGLLWTPEVRHAADAEDLIRRMQSVICSPQALVNAWYIQNPPWEQWDTRQNNEGVRAQDWEQVERVCRDIFNLRMQLVPYLYAAFARYSLDGTPPFRALVLDYPHDEQVRTIDDQYMMGASLMVAPLFAGQSSRNVYLPEGTWWDYWTGTKYGGGQAIEYPATLETFPLFVRDGAILPLAHVTQHAGDPSAMNLDVRVYGDGNLEAMLFEDDGHFFGYQNGQYNRAVLRWDPVQKQGGLLREGSYAGPLYQVRNWSHIGGD